MSHPPDATTPHYARHPRPMLDMETAVRRTHLGWLLTLMAIGVLAVVVVVVAGRSGYDVAPDARPEGAALAWMVIALAWIALVTPLAMVLRSYVLRSAWSEEPVEPHSLVKGSNTIWVVLLIGAIIGLLGGLFTGDLLAALLPASLAVILLMAMRPGRG